MPIDFHCWGCSANHRVPDRLAGTPFRCRICGNEGTVPASTRAARAATIAAALAGHEDAPIPRSALAAFRGRRGPALRGE